MMRWDGDCKPNTSQNLYGTWDHINRVHWGDLNEYIGHLIKPWKMKLVCTQSKSLTIKLKGLKWYKKK